MTMNVIKVLLLTLILASFTACSNQSDIDEAVATAVAKSLATPTAVPIPTATELPIYEGSPMRASATEDSMGNLPRLFRGGNFKMQVVRVIDGDTIVVDPISDKSKLYFKPGTRVRYLDIDTPETVHPDKSVECYGPEATLRNKQLVEGKVVVIGRFNPKTPIANSMDQYGRILAYVYTDEYFVNAELVWGGFAYDYKGKTDGFISRSFEAWEADAKKNKRGLWGKCN